MLMVNKNQVSLLLQFVLGVSLHALIVRGLTTRAKNLLGAEITKLRDPTLIIDLEKRRYDYRRRLRKRT